MIALILSILSSTVIFVVFKMFERFKIVTLHAIVVNYFVAFFCGFISHDQPVSLPEIMQFQWFPFTLILGALFIIVFNLMAITTQRNGLSVVSVATKMSVVIPIVFGLIYYSESLGILKFFGILLALIAVYLASIKTKEGLAIKSSNLLFPALVFLGSGTIDTTIKYLEGKYVAENDVALFSATIFAAAAIIGVSILSIHAFKGKLNFKPKSIIGGIALGIPNYLSVYFLVLALRSDVLESSGIFTVNNVAVVMISTLTGILFFKEKLLRKNWIGIGLAVLGILLVALGKW